MEIKTVRASKGTSNSVRKVVYLGTKSSFEHMDQVCVHKRPQNQWDLKNMLKYVIQSSVDGGSLYKIDQCDSVIKSMQTLKKMFKKEVKKK